MPNGAKPTRSQSCEGRRFSLLSGCNSLCDMYHVQGLSTVVKLSRHTSKKEKY